MSRDQIPYKEIVQRLNDQAETIANDCLMNVKQKGTRLYGDCHGECSVVIRGHKVGLVGFWQGQRPDAQGGNLVHLIEVNFGCSSHGDAVKLAKRKYLNIDDRPPTEDEKRQWAEARRKAEQRREQNEADHTVSLQRRTELAKRIWKGTQPIRGTLAETYFRGRGIDERYLPELPRSLRFHPHLRYTSDYGPAARYFPAVICGVQAKDRSLIAVWQIFLDPATGGKARLNEEKQESAKLGFGPAAGGAVRLGPLSDPLIVCEGVETGLAAGLLNGWEHSVWCLLSTSGMRNFDLPDGLNRLWIYEDGDRHRFNKLTGEVVDPPGQSAGAALEERALKAGVGNVERFPAPEPGDWLDVWNTTKETL